MNQPKKDIKQQCVEVYREFQNLKLTGDHLGIPWQTVYVHLKSVNEPVVGNKRLYGSDADKFAAEMEDYFQSLVPDAVPMNRKQYQAKTDFRYKGYLIDVKAANPEKSSKKYNSTRWSFHSKKQQYEADFLVCFLCVGNKPNHIIFVPKELFQDKQSISVSQSKKGKWWEFLISEQELSQFFKLLPTKPPTVVK